MFREAFLTNPAESEALRKKKVKGKQRRVFSDLL